MRRRVLLAALTAGLLGLAGPAPALLSGSSSNGGTWACGGVEVVAGVCVGNPLQGLLSVLLGR